MDRCKDCKFFNGEDECRRRPPTLVAHEKDVVTGFYSAFWFWPEVSPDDWCGEFKSPDEKMV